MDGQAPGTEATLLERRALETEVVEPGLVSERILGEPPLTRVDFAVDGSGGRLHGDELIDCGRWLWFRPTVTALLSSYRGSSLIEYTRDTGIIGISRGHSVHFGLNDLGLLNVYAKDIGQLPLWQQRCGQGQMWCRMGAFQPSFWHRRHKLPPPVRKLRRCSYGRHMTAHRGVSNANRAAFVRCASCC